GGEVEAGPADGACPERTGGHVRDGDVAVPHVREGLRAHVVVGDPLEDRAGLRPGDEDRTELRGLIEEMDVEAPAVDPVTEPRFHRGGPSRRRTEVEAAPAEGGKETVADHAASLVERDEVARAARRQVADTDREHAVHEL